MVADTDRAVRTLEVTSSMVVVVRSENRKSLPTRERNWLPPRSTGFTGFSAGEPVPKMSRARLV